MAAKKTPIISKPMDDPMEQMPAELGVNPRSVQPAPPAVTPTTTPVSPTTTVPETVSPTTTAAPVDITKLTPEQMAAYFASLTSGTQTGNTGLPSSYKMPTRKWTNKQGVVQTYSGNQLINLRTGALQDMYLINQDPTAIIGTKLNEDGPQGLLKFLKNIQSLGFYQGGRVGNGSSDNDISAVANFLRYSNMQGLEMNSALVVAQQQIPANFRVDTGGAQVTNPSDLRAIFESVAMSTIGRGLSDSQINAMIAAYQQQERSAGYGGTSAPQAQTYASETLRSKFKGEAQDYRAMNVADSMLNIIRSS